MLEEKDELINVIKMQISILKKGQVIPEELDEQLIEAQRKNDDHKKSDDKKELQDKIRRLELLLSKCKETIKSNKEKTALLTGERDALHKQLETSQQQIKKMEEQQKDAKTLMLDLETDKAMALAEAKQQMHITLEGKDTELIKTRDSIKKLQAEKAELDIKVAKLVEQGEEQLQKSRDIVNKLNEENKDLTDEMNEKLATAKS